MESKPVAAMHPEWNIEQTVAGDEERTLNLDALPTSRAIRAKADTPDEINQMFDGISYGKASDVLLMVENYLGEETFRQGVHNYLAAHLYANATAEDFWNAQTATSHKPVDKIMESLVAQPGVPILTFGAQVNGAVTVKQTRFYLSPGIAPDIAQKWTLPVCFKIPGASEDCQVLSPGDSTLKPPTGALFFGNAGGKGYYRSAYPPSEHAALVAQVETGLTPAERIRLIGDEWAQARANKTPIGAYLDLAAAVKSDPGAEVVGAALSGIDATYDRIAASAEERGALAVWIRSTFASEYAKLGPPSNTDSANSRELRAKLLGLLGFYGKDPAALAQAQEIAARYLANPGTVDATLGQTALAIAARNGDAKLFDQLQQIYETSTNPEYQENALRLLVQFEKPALLQRALDYAASGKVRNQDAVLQFMIALSIDENREQTWKYIQNNWDKVQAQFTTGVGAYLVGSTGSFCTADSRASVETFFSTHKVAASDKALKHALESIDGCIELRTLQEPSLKQWLAARQK
jgi:aminopeptidase N/puromycin-sensitive aminopeptidase